MSTVGTTTHAGDAGIARAERQGTDLFQVGPHTVRVSKAKERRWTFVVDDGAVSSTFPTKAAAWAAGMRAAFFSE